MERTHVTALSRFVLRRLKCKGNPMARVSKSAASEAASAMASKRWEKTTDGERIEHAKKMAAGRWDGMSAADRAKAMAPVLAARRKKMAERAIRSRVKKPAKRRAKS